MSKATHQTLTQVGVDDRGLPHYVVQQGRIPKSQWMFIGKSPAKAKHLYKDWLEKEKAKHVLQFGYNTVSK